jgi:hypothetical protein
MVIAPRHSSRVGLNLFWTSQCNRREVNSGPTYKKHAPEAILGGQVGPRLGRGRRANNRECRGGAAVLRWKAAQNAANQAAGNLVNAGRGHGEDLSGSSLPPQCHRCRSRAAFRPSLRPHSAEGNWNVRDGLRGLRCLEYRLLAAQDRHQGLAKRWLHRTPRAFRRRKPPARRTLDRVGIQMLKGPGLGEVDPDAGHATQPNRLAGRGSRVSHRPKRGP